MLSSFENTDCQLSQGFLLMEQKPSAAGRVKLRTGFHMDIWVFSLGSVAKGGKSTYLFWNQSAMPDKIFKKSSCFLKAQSSLYSKFYSCNGSYGQNYCGSLLSLLPSPLKTLRKKKRKNLNFCLAPRLLPSQEHSVGCTGLSQVGPRNEV